MTLGSLGRGGVLLFALYTAIDLHRLLIERSLPRSKLSVELVLLCRLLDGRNRLEAIFPQPFLTVSA